jgi:hypothetical protein
MPDATSWSWDLNGDGSSDCFLRDPSWIYTKAKNYNVILTINGFVIVYGCSNDNRLQCGWDTPAPAGIIK